MNLEEFLDRIERLFKLWRGDVNKKVGFKLIGYGIIFLGGTRVLNWAIETSYIKISVNTSLFDIGSVIGLIFIIIGLGFIVLPPIVNFFRSISWTKNKLTIVIQHKGLERTLAGHIKNDIPNRFKSGTILPIEINQSQYFENGQVVSPEKSLTELMKLEEKIENANQGFHVSDVQLIYGGVASVPFMFLAGYILSNRQQCRVMDYDRNKQCWHCLGEYDRGVEIEVDEISESDEKELAIVIAISYPISNATVKEAISDNMRIYHLTANEIGNDNFSSYKAQIRCSKLFHNFLNKLPAFHPQLERVHVFCAAQASFSFMLGRQLAPKNHGTFFIYEYSRGSVPKYPWAVKIEPGKEPVIQRTFSDS